MMNPPISTKKDSTPNGSVEQDRTLTATYYTSEEVLELEKRNLFFK